MPETKKRTAAKKSKKKTKKKQHPILKGIWNFLKSLNAFAIRPNEDNVKREYRVFGRKVTFVGFMCIILVSLFLIVLAMNDRSVNVNNEEIILTGLPEEFENYRILHISDLQGRTFGQDQSALKRIIDNLSYDMVVFTGDVVGKDGDPTAFYSLIEVLNSRKPVYFIPGDNDPSYFLAEARDNSSETLTLSQMVLSDWVLGAQERGAILLDTPAKITKNGAVMWLVPDTFLNLNVTQAADLLKEEVEQQKDSMLVGIDESREALPFTNYRYNTMYKTTNLLPSVTSKDLIVMLAHEVPTDSQIYVSQDTLTADDMKSYFPAPDLILSGHFCGGEWRLPGLGAIHISSSMSARFGWFPNQDYVQGQRTVGGSVVYTSPGLSVTGDTLFSFRFMNPPRITLVTLTGELPASFLE